MRSWLGALLLVLSACSLARAQLVGRVIDVQSQNGIHSAHVVIQSATLRRETFTDAQGVYRFTGLPAGQYDVYAAHVSYDRANLRVLLAANRAIMVDIPLDPQPFVLAPVVVPVTASDERVAFDVAATDTLLLTTPTSLLHESRMPAGLADLTSARSADPSPPPGQNAPHVLHIIGSGGERGAAMIDGVLLGAPLHLGGVLPQLSPDAVSAAALQTGGASARFDGGSSYILEYRTRAPRADELSMHGDVGMLAVNLSANTPISPNAAASVSVRRVNDGLLEALTPAPFGYAYRDAIARVDWRTGGSSGLRALLLGTHEGVRIPRDQGYDAVQWGNHAAALTWQADTTGDGLELGASFSRGRARLPLLSAPEGKMTATVDRVGATLAQQWRLPGGRVVGGLQYEHARVERAGSAEGVACNELLPCSTARASTVSAFGDVTTLLGRATKLHAGLRANVTGDRIDLLPRVSLAFAHNGGTTVSLSFGRFSQLAVAQPDMSAFNVQREHAAQAELDVRQAAGLFTFAGTGRLLFVDIAPSRDAVLPAAEGYVAANLGPARLSAGFALKQRATMVRDTVQRRVQREVFFGAATSTGDVHVQAAIVHGRDLPLTSIVLDGVAPPQPELYTPGASPVPTGRQQHTRLDVAVKGLWEIRLGGRHVRLAPYARLINPFHADALFYYQQSGSADLRPLSALPTMPVLGMEWTF